MAAQIITLIRGIPRRLALTLIVVYQYLFSPFFAGSCRFYPSCSEYAKTVFTHYGLLQALLLTVCRLLRCHPFATGGVDLPPKKSACCSKKMLPPQKSD
ncbi:membrane protein insertion efficiency factor YidD [Candidatus Persebacteraceae bacterium Df01]|jgi:putative membrane protein insertion efficiency factor|uniref:Putative membrane protein insertion efficiency factor n=1 Tax=Candidatus Doriopsillibacter californiensis TaxID=2970740 RepID=A0ABT7QMZ4_9GAMM|nr:membrane protein insertion efficiency factor YidD [Candidatus Persebacteraceae bacterium Df01]